MSALLKFFWIRGRIKQNVKLKAHCTGNIIDELLVHVQGVTIANVTEFSLQMSTESVVLAVQFSHIEMIWFFVIPRDIELHESIKFVEMRPRLFPRDWKAFI